MIDSTNPRIMVNNIRELESKISANDVEGNPSGSGYNTLLTKMKIGGNKFKLPGQVVANPSGSATSEVTKLEVGGTIYSIGGSSGVDFSLTEQDTGLKWIDGSPIYQKTYEITSVFSSWTPLETNEDVDTILSCSHLICSDSTDNLAYFCRARVVRSSGSVDYKCENQVTLASGTKAYVTINYTKKASE